MTQPGIERKTSAGTYLKCHSGVTGLPLDHEAEDAMTTLTSGCNRQFHVMRGQLHVGGKKMTTTRPTNRFSEFFGCGHDSIEVEYSRYRFALADRPDMAERWAAIQREYRQIQAAREALASE